MLNLIHKRRRRKFKVNQKLTQIRIIEIDYELISMSTFDSSNDKSKIENYVKRI